MFSGSLCAIVTPMRADGSVDFGAWARLIDFHVQHQTGALIVGGTTGESPTLEPHELNELVRRACEQAAGRLQIIAGAGTNSTAATVARVRAFADLPIDGLLLVTPAYNRPTQEGLFRHFEAAAAAARAPVVLYNVPSRTAVDMLPATVARLSQLPGIVAVKEAVPDIGRVRSLLAECRPGFSVLSGDDPTAREALLAGAHGVISVTANVAPGLMRQMIETARAGNTAQAASIDAKLASAHRDLFLEANPIPVKWALNRMGLIDTGIRLPLTPLSAGHHAAVLSTLRAAGIEA